MVWMVCLEVVETAYRWVETEVEMGKVEEQVVYWENLVEVDEAKAVAVTMEAKVEETAEMAVGTARAVAVMVLVARAVLVEKVVDSVA